MAPNAADDLHGDELLLHPALEHATTTRGKDDPLTAMLDKRSDVNGSTTVDDDRADWTDAKHSERKKRDRILPDGVLLKLMEKSDYEGFKRLLSNLSLLFLTAYCIKRMDVFPLDSNTFTMEKLLKFIPLYVFYGFQMQCFAFAGGHEMLHGNAFRTKWINNTVCFIIGVAFFEVLKHERLMHKQHHTFTLNIDKDPELTSYYSREELEQMDFKSIPSSRFSYIMQFVDVINTFRYRVMRLISSSLGIATDYTGTGWSMKTSRNIDKRVLRDLQISAILQLTIYVAIFALFSTTYEGTSMLLFWWIIPCIIGYAPINFFRNLEHAHCDMSTNGLLNTRTVHSNRFIRWLLWETNFHAEHHVYPMVPFFNLPVLNSMMDKHIKHNECRHFTSQNWQLVKSGGWIDEQQCHANGSAKESKAKNM